MRSSYALNDLGGVLAEAVIAAAPLKVVEFGVLDGYSTLAIAQALQFQYTEMPHLWAYDLWDWYQFEHGNFEDVERRIIEAGLAQYVSLGQRDFFDFLNNPEPFDFLHLDISNDGDIIEAAIEKFLPQIETGSTIVFEGGSEERDNEPWMLEYKRRPIHDIKYPYELLTEQWPSMSIVNKEVLDAFDAM